MAPPTLSDYQYQFRDSGPVMNGNSFPMWDVTRIDGIHDVKIKADVIEADMRHGGFIFARYMDPRPISIAGTLQASTGDLSTPIAAMRAVFVPDITDVNAPLYIKVPGVSQRSYLCKPTTFQIAHDRNVALKRAEFQFQLEAEDPRAYSEETTTNFTSGVGQNLTNLGDFVSHPIGQGSVTSGQAVTWRLENSTLGFWVQIQFTAAASGTVIVDTSTRTVSLNGIPVIATSYTVNGSWPYMIAGVNNMKIETVNSSSLQLKWRSAWGAM